MKVPGTIRSWLASLSKRAKKGDHESTTNLLIQMGVRFEGSQIDMGPAVQPYEHADAYIEWASCDYFARCFRILDQASAVDGVIEVLVKDMFTSLEDTCAQGRHPETGVCFWEEVEKKSDIKHWKMHEEYGPICSRNYALQMATALMEAREEELK